MNLFSIVSLSVCLLCTILGLFAFSQIKNRLHLIWALFNLDIAIWSAGTFLAGIAGTESAARIDWKLSHIGVLFIPVLFYHTVHLFLASKNKTILFLLYLQAAIFSVLLIFTDFIIYPIKYLFGSIYYYVATPGYYVMFLIWVSVVIIPFFKLYKSRNLLKGLKHQQWSYLFWGSLIGFLGGPTIVAPAFGLNIYPAWHFTICIYVLTATYAIFRYQLMDIRVAVTRLSIFVFVYSLVLGIPVWLGFKLLGKGLWLLPVTCMGIFSTLGPFIYLFIQKRAENRLLQEQRRYQATLRQASAGMGKIKDLKKLLGMIVYVLTHAIQIGHALIYIYDEGQKKYVLGASKRKSGNNRFIESVEKDSPLVQYFQENKNSVIYEEIKQKALDSKDPSLIQIEQIMVSLEGALGVPIFIDQSLTAIIIMGKKESGKVYTEDDLGVFSILANQTALAIENAVFYEQMKLTHEQLFQAEKMATIGTMADGLSHQINNRFHALGFIAGDALDTIHLNQNDLTPEKMKEIMIELDRAFVRVQENVVQGGEIVQGLLKYTRKGDAGFTAVDADAVLKAALEMVQFKIKMHELKIVRDYDLAVIPKIKGNFTQLQEVFLNLIDNGYDAMMQRKNEKKEADYQPTLIVRVFKKDDYAQIILEDNGMGVKDEDMHKLFTPFFTTKLSSKKGTGLGLYVIKKIVEDNHGGQVEMVSKYMQGTQMKLRLPIAIG
jgi:signal transduction histidine kinase